MAVKTFILIQFLLLINAYYHFTTTTAAPMDDVCHQALNQAFCLLFFRSNPAAKTANLPFLAQMAITSAQSNGTSTKAKIESLLQSATDPRLKSVLIQCDRFYLDAVNALRAMPDDLNRRLYRDLSLHAGVASDAGARCESLFNVPVQLPITDENLTLRYLGNVIGIIANGLNSGGKNRRKSDLGA